MERTWLTSLLEVGQVLASAVELDDALHRVLERVEKHHGVEQSAITALDPVTEEISIQASLGMGREERNTRYRLGEGITGRVVQSGKPIVVPELSKEPLFLNRAFKKKG